MKTHSSKNVFIKISFFRKIIIVPKIIILTNYLYIKLFITHILVLSKCATSTCTQISRANQDVLCCFQLVWANDATDNNVSLYVAFLAFSCNAIKRS